MDGTITKNTAAAIAFAYSEIEASEELLKIISDRLPGDNPDFRDAFGRRKGGLQLGVPSGSNGHRLLDVGAGLAKIIIAAHINEKRAEIHALCAVAVGELGFRSDTATDSPMQLCAVNAKDTL